MSEVSYWLLSRRNNSAVNCQSDVTLVKNNDWRGKEKLNLGEFIIVKQYFTEYYQEIGRKSMVLMLAQP